jgi:hypothetical protein
MCLDGVCQCQREDNRRANVSDTGLLLGPDIPYGEGHPVEPETTRTSDYSCEELLNSFQRWE